MKKNWYDKFIDLLNSKTSEDSFEEYLVIRKFYTTKKNEIKKKKKKSLPTINDEIELEKLFENKVKAGKEFINVAKGLFVGVGVDLTNPKDIMLIYHEWNKLKAHYFVYGTSQVGKSRLLASHVRQMIMNNWNVVVIDPKGGEGQEILSWVIEFAGEAGRAEDLFYISPVYSDYTDCLNPIYGLENEEIASMIQLLCKGSGNSEADFFADFGYKVILSILYSLEFLETVNDLDGSIVKERINNELVNYYRLLELKGVNSAKYSKLNKIILPDVSERMNTKRKGFKKHTAAEYAMAVDRTLITFKELAHYSNFENLQHLITTMINFSISKVDDEEINMKLLYLKGEATSLMANLKSIDEGFFIKVSTSLTTLLTQISSGKIGQLLCTVRINPIINRLFREDKGLICVIQPAPLKFQKVSEMVLKIFLKMFESVFGLIGATGRGMTRRVGLIIDEAKTCMYPGIEELYNKSAQLGMTIGAYTQSRGDIQYKLGPALAEVVEDCVNTLYYLRTNSQTARAYMSENFGKKRKHNYNYTAQAGVTDGRFMIETIDEEVVSEDSLKGLGIGQAFMLHAGEKYRVELPYQPNPLGRIEMPKLKEEQMIYDLTKLEILIEKEIKEIDSFNLESKGISNE